MAISAIRHEVDAGHGPPGTKTTSYLYGLLCLGAAGWEYETGPRTKAEAWPGSARDMSVQYIGYAVWMPNKRGGDVVSACAYVSACSP